MENSNGGLVFLLPIFYAFHESIFASHIDIVPIIVSGVATIVGVSKKLSEKRVKGVLTGILIVDLYITGIVSGMLSYGIYIYTENLYILMVVAVLASYLGIELLKGLKEAVLKIVSLLPDMAQQYLTSWLKNRDKNDTK